MPTVLSRKTVQLTEEQSKIVDEFFRRFPFEEDCIEKICKFTAPRTCVHCGSEDLVRPYGSRVSNCRMCKGKMYCTSDTFFYRGKKIQAMLACIYFFEKGFFIPSTKLSEIFGVAIATAHKIIKKVSHVLKEHMKIELPKITSAKFLRLFAKRSTETPARKHPLYEQKVLEEELKSYEDEKAASEANSDSEANDADDAKLADRSQDNCASLINETDASILNYIQDVPISFDELAALNLRSPSELAGLLGIFEIEGLIKRLPGDRYVRFRPNEDEVFFVNLAHEVEDNLDQIAFIIQFVLSNFGGCSRKYLNLYLAKHWCHRDRSRWRDGQLLSACLDYGYISFKSIYASVTPLITNFCPF